MLFALLALSGTAVFGQSGCASKQVRSSTSEFGAEAIETIRLCVANKFITTGDNQIFIRPSKRSKPVLLVTLASVGKIGLPLSWRGKVLIVHLPAQYKQQYVQVVHPKVGEVSIEFANDYSNEQQLRDSNS